MKFGMMLEVDESFTTIWLSRSSEVRVKVRRWLQSPFGTIFWRTGPARNDCRTEGQLSKNCMCGCWSYNMMFLIIAAFSTERECDRRQTMMDQLVTRQKQLELTFENRDQRSIQRCVFYFGCS